MWGSDMSTPKYKRIVLKLSGEALAGEQGYGIDSTVLTSISRQIKEISELGVEVAIVVGGGQNVEWIEQLRTIWVC
jgi:uridylate kinase